MKSTQHREPWNEGKLVGQKPPLKPKDTSYGSGSSGRRTNVRKASGA